jgi:hypothetical protein
MAGMQEAAMQPPMRTDAMTAGAPQGQPPGAQQAQPQDQGEAASPEEQKLYDDVVTRAYSLIFDVDKGEVRPQILEGLKGGDDPKEALAQTAATVFFRVLQAAAQAGQEIPPDVEENAGKEVFEKLAEIASAVGPMDFMQDDDAFQGAFFLAVDELRQQKQAAGMIDQQAAQGDFQDLAAADQDGRLAQIMQGLQ